MSDRPPYPQSWLPSYQYATRKIAELEHLFPNVDDYRPTSRSQKYHLLLFKRCQTIVARSYELARLFKSIVVGLEGQVKLYDWEKEFLFRIEVRGSIGWSYLCEPNFNLIVGELRRCGQNRHELYEAKKDHIKPKYSVSSILDGVKEELQTPSDGRYQLLKQILDSINKEAKEHSLERQDFFNAWTSNVEKIVKEVFKRDPTCLRDLENWLRIEVELEDIRNDPVLATEPNVLRQVADTGSVVDRWQILKHSEMCEVVSAMMAAPRDITPPPDYVPAPGYVPAAREARTPPPGYEALALSHSRRISHRQAKLRRDVPTFGSAPGGGLLI